METVIRRVAEPEVDADTAAELRELLRESFPDYPDRTYYKLPPHFRYLATVDGRLAGHLGGELRVVRVGDEAVRLFGIVDVCVRQDARSHGLATRLLAEITEYASTCGLDHLMLFADDDRLYTRAGWTHVDNRLSWVRIDEHATLGLATNETVRALMVKTIGSRRWPAGDVDLLGHLF
ncbi:MAG TPA: GNAT family N-acetyltransferase [Actinophytocola sp.]|nr:GNAT family N-acetyltransferase [Actinophytocola sp.]